MPVGADDTLGVRGLTPEGFGPACLGEAGLGETGFGVALAETAFFDAPCFKGACFKGACFGVTGFATALVPGIFGDIDGGAVPVDILNGSSIRRPACPGLRKGGDFGVKIDMFYSLFVL